MSTLVLFFLITRKLLLIIIQTGITRKLNYDALISFLHDNFIIIIYNLYDFTTYIINI